ncbi:MAG: hypothetical protein AABW73_02520 [Nanoarchaeota archaeon]
MIKDHLRLPQSGITDYSGHKMVQVYATIAGREEPFMFFSETRGEGERHRLILEGGLKELGISFEMVDVGRTDKVPAPTGSAYRIAGAGWGEVFAGAGKYEGKRVLSVSNPDLGSDDYKIRPSRDHLVDMQRILGDSWVVGYDRKAVI